MSNAPRARSFLSPFLFRALRGGRRARAILAALVLSALSVVTGLWIAQGDHAFEREVRVGLDLEPRRWEREQAEVIRLQFSDEAYEHALRIRDRAMAAVDAGRIPDDSEVRTFLKSAFDEASLLSMAARVAVPADLDPARREHLDGLRREATRLMARLQPIYMDLDLGFGDLHRDPYFGGVPWTDEREVRRLERIVELGGLPEIVRYRSPMGPAETAGLIGLAAGFLLFVGGMVVVPFAAGSLLAHEVHAGTMAPLLGTGLSTVQVLVGSFVGAAARIGIVLAPLGAIFLATAAFAGGLGPALGALATLCIVTVALSAVAMVGGHALGRRLMPLATSGLLLAVLVPSALVAWFVGLFAAMGLPESGPVIGLWPQVAVAHALRTAALPLGLGVPAQAVVGFEDVQTVPGDALPHLAGWLELFVCLAAVACVGFLSFRALVRRVGTTTGPSLRRSEAAVAYAVLTSCALLALGWIPEITSPGWITSHHDARHLVPIAAFLVTVPAMAMLAAARVDGRAVRLGVVRTVGPEIAAAVVAGLAAVLLSSPGALEDLPAAHAVSSYGRAAWVALSVCLGVLVLAVRPPRFAGATLLGLAFLAVLVIGIEALAIAEDAPRATSSVFFPAAEASPMLAAAEIAVLVVFPLACVLRLRPAKTRLDVAA
ncbi:MAG: hypothetical protein D6705_18360 [Deltaproteobacteria bacterium]|nr:MAG: hypothetical protein D6705_18360 [Deltaproteobacteria bacterium]